MYPNTNPSDVVNSQKIIGLINAVVLLLTLVGL
jgi:hypothetical protein